MNKNVNELGRWVSLSLSKIKSEKELKQIIESLRKKGKKIVFTNGCFDILHIGHVRYLAEAKSLGDVLVVAVNTDASVKQFKSDKRPVVPEQERAEMLAALESVDYVVLFNDKLPSRIIALLRPDIHVKGGDYTINKLPEARVVMDYGGKVRVLKEIKGKSTTNIIKKIIGAYGGNK